MPPVVLGYQLHQNSQCSTGMNWPSYQHDTHLSTNQIAAPFDHASRVNCKSVNELGLTNQLTPVETMLASPSYAQNFISTTPAESKLSPFDESQTQQQFYWPGVPYTNYYHNHQSIVGGEHCNRQQNFIANRGEAGKFPNLYEHPINSAYRSLVSHPVSNTNTVLHFNQSFLPLSNAQSTNNLQQQPHQSHLPGSFDHAAVFDPPQQGFPNGANGSSLGGASGVSMSNIATGGITFPNTSSTHALNPAQQSQHTALVTALQANNQSNSCVQPANHTSWSTANNSPGHNDSTRRSLSDLNMKAALVAGAAPRSLDCPAVVQSQNPPNCPEQSPVSAAGGGFSTSVNLQSADSPLSSNESLHNSLHSPTTSDNISPDRKYFLTPNICCIAC